MRVRIINLAEDYPMLESWWIGHGWPAVPAAILPKLGVITEHEGKPIAAGWVYMDNSIGVCMLEWLVTDPAAPPRQTFHALGHVIDFLKFETKKLDYGVMLGTCKQPGLSKVLQRHGFAVSDTAMIHHLAPL